MKKRAYRRDDSGILEIVSIVRIEREWTYRGQLLEKTSEIVDLWGWPDSRARVWLDERGVEILVPIRK